MVEETNKKVLDFAKEETTLPAESVEISKKKNTKKKKTAPKKKATKKKTKKKTKKEKIVEPKKEEDEEKKDENVNVNDENEAKSNEKNENDENETSKKETEVVAEKKKRKRSFRLHEFNPDHGRAPKGGGYYCGSSPQAVALKAANRWVCPKDEFDNVREFFMKESSKFAKEKKIYAFKAKRIKLDPPKTYTRGGREIVVDSKIVIV